MKRSKATSSGIVTFPCYQLEDITEDGFDTVDEFVKFLNGLTEGVTAVANEDDCELTVSYKSKPALKEFFVQWVVAKGFTVDDVDIEEHMAELGI